MLLAHGDLILGLAIVIAATLAHLVGWAVDKLRARREPGA